MAMRFSFFPRRAALPALLTLCLSLPCAVSDALGAPQDASPAARSAQNSGRARKAAAQSGKNKGGTEKKKAADTPNVSNAPTSGQETPPQSEENAAPVPQEPPQANPRSALAQISPSQVRLGEPFTLTIEVTDRTGTVYELARDFSLGPDADILETGRPVDKEGADGFTTRTFTVKAALFKLGETSLPDIRLTAAGPDGNAVLKIDGPKLVGAGVLKEGEEAGLGDILPPVKVGIPSYLVLWILLGILAAAGLFFAGLRAWKRWKKRAPRPAPAAPPAPLDQRALSALHALRKEDLPSQGREREMFFRLSEIERGYMGERYGFNALDLTTEEFLAALTRMHTPGLDFRRLEDRFREGDFARFAKAHIPASDCKQAIEDAIVLVQGTTAAAELEAKNRTIQTLPSVPAVPSGTENGSSSESGDTSGKGDKP